MIEKKKHGKGWYHYRNGDIFYGNWIINLKNGFGQFFYSCGDIYRGYWVDNKKQGYGEYYYKNGDFFKGEWLKNKKDGKGIYKYRDKSEFRGQFKNNLKTGRCFRKEKNNIFKEIWNNGKFVTSVKINKKDTNGEELLREDVIIYKYTKENKKDIKLFNYEIKNKKTIHDTNSKKKLDTIQLSSIFTARSDLFDSISLNEYKEQLSSVYDKLVIKKVDSWDNQDVCDFLEKINLKEYVPVFKKHQIRGKSLIKIKKEDLKQMGIIILADLIKLIHSVKKLKTLNDKDIRKKILKIKPTRIASIKLSSIEEKFLSFYNTGKGNIIEERSQEYSSSSNYSKSKKSNSIENSKIAKNDQKKEKNNNNKYISLACNTDINTNKSNPTYSLNFKNNNNKPVMTPEKKKKGLSYSSESSEELLPEIKLRKKNSKKISLYEKSSFSQFIIKKKRLKIKRLLSEGGFGKVYLGTYIGQKVAIKVYKKLKDKKYHIESFLKEVEILSNLRHPNILLYMGICVDKENCFMIAEYLENGSLFDHLHKDHTTNLPLDSISHIIKSILKALTYTHRKGILHCDLKSSNILIDHNWNIKVADFGLSKKVISNREKGRVGTPNWMAPEICRGESNTAASDVYSFGIVVWEIVTKRIPYQGKTMTEIMDLIGYSHNFPLGIPKKCDPLLYNIMIKCIQFDSKSRPSFEELLEDFDNNYKQN